MPHKGICAEETPVCIVYYVRFSITSKHRAVDGKEQTLNARFTAHNGTQNIHAHTKTMRKHSAESKLGASTFGWPDIH